MTGERGSKSPKFSVTYFMDSPYIGHHYILNFVLRAFPFVACIRLNESRDLANFLQTSVQCSIVVRLVPSPRSDPGCATAGQDRLAALALVSIENELTRTMSFDAMIQSFAQVKARKSQYR